MDQNEQMKITCQLRFILICSVQLSVNSFNEPKIGEN